MSASELSAAETKAALEQAFGVPLIHRGGGLFVTRQSIQATIGDDGEPRFEAIDKPDDGDEW